MGTKFYQYFIDSIIMLLKLAKYEVEISFIYLLCDIFRTSKALLLTWFNFNPRIHK